ncbi:MAG: Fe2+-dependent dioxygenase [Deltaproteobacteria bacterium]|nr:Fe2+-dependent dioxygenase [Deltaproteobacteria bacterium]
MTAIFIEKAIPEEALVLLRQMLRGGPYVSGRGTAVGGAARLKNNVQLAPSSPAAEQAAQVLVAALNDSAAFQAATWIDAMMTPLFCRYEPGMTYGDHIDAAIMGEPPNLVRCDIAVTVCLSDASSYDGGELVIDAAGVAGRWKGNAGDCVIYPAGTLHRVEPVTRGARDVAVLWIQSLVRDPGQRRILFDLTTVLEQLDRSGTPGPQIEALRRSYFNLVRMWA